jgi:acetyltransferase-like isoleucine patch superfamily enzyme
MKKCLYRVSRFLVSKSGSEKKIRFWRKQGVKFGENCRVETMDFGTEPYLIEIGNSVSISNGTTFINHDAGISIFREEFPKDDVFGKIIIEDNVFIGMKSILLPNTHIGNNCIIGAGSVVRGKFPDNSVIIGNPAKLLIGVQAQRFLYRQNPNRTTTHGMTDAEKKPFVIRHFLHEKAKSKNCY